MVFNITDVHQAIHDIRLNVCRVALVFLLLINALPAFAYDEARWGDDPTPFRMVPNLEDTPKTQHDPYYGPPGYRKHKPPPVETAPVPPKKKGLFGKKTPAPTAPESPKITTEMLTQVGPREYRPSPEPLLRLSRTIALPNGATLPPDVYLVAPQGLWVDAIGRLHRAPEAIALLHRGRIVATWPLSLYRNISDVSPLEQGVNPSPYTSPEERRAPYRHVQLLLSPDGQAGQLLYQVGDVQFITPPFEIR
jgi:hypothetical protein